MAQVYTIGHSTHAVETFHSLLKMHHITAVGDVRSSPYSRVNPQYNEYQIKESLRAAGIVYVFLGRELGARPDDADCYEAGRVYYDLIACTAYFTRGLDRVELGAADYRLALMCAEKDPLDCHRTILVGRYLVKRGYRIQHILEDGTLEAHEETMARLMRQQGLDTEDMFRSHAELVAHAYRRRESEIAYASSTQIGAAPTGDAE